jgi:hypothetical protein
MENIEEKIKVILQKGKTFDDFLEAYNYFLHYQNSKDGKLLSQILKQEVYMW